MKLGNLCSLSSSQYSSNSNYRSVSSLKNAYKIKDYSGGSVSDRDSVSGRSKRSRISRKGSNGLIKPAKTMSKKLDFTNLAYREAVGRLKFLLEESYAPTMKQPSQYRKHCIEDSGEETDNQSQATDRPPLSEISRYLAPSHKSQVPKKTIKSYSPHRTSRYTGSGDYSVPPPPPPVPAASEVGQAPPEIINFIEKQEDYIEQLEKESKFCRDELSNLLGKVRDVINENEALTEQARSDLAGNMGHHTKLTTSSESDDNHYSKLNRSRKDKTSKPTTSLSGPSIVFESRISELEAELAQANIDLKKLRNEHIDLKRKSNLGGEVEFAALEAYRRRVENLERDKVHLEENCKKLQRKVEDLHAENSQATTKTKRDREMADMAMFEKSQDEMEIRRLKEDLERQHERIRELQHEMTRRIAEERTNAERRYHYHVDQLGGDLSSQWDQASKLQMELERQKRFEADLKRELTQRNTQIESLKQELKESKMAYLTDLTHINAEKQSLEQEITSLRLQLDKSERQGKVEAARLNAEINSLRQRLDRADADILQARRENLKLNDEIANLEKDLALGELKGEIRPTTKEINKTIMDIEKKHAETVSELEDMIQSQRQLMDKLTTECKTLTSKLEETSLTHKMEISALQSNVEFLTNRMISTDRLSKTDTYSNLPSQPAPIDYNQPTSFSDHDNQPTSADTTARDYSPVTQSTPHHDYAPAYDSPQTRPTPTSAETYQPAYNYGDNEKGKDDDNKEYSGTSQDDTAKPYESEQPKYSKQPDPTAQYSDQQYQQPSYQEYDQQQYGESNYNTNYDQPYDISQFDRPQQQYDDYDATDYNQTYRPETDLYSSNTQQSLNYTDPSAQPSISTRKLSPPPTTSSTPIPSTGLGTGLQSYQAPATASSISGKPLGTSAAGASGIGGPYPGNVQGDNQPRKGTNNVGPTIGRNGERRANLLSQQSTEATKRMPTSSVRD